MPKHLLRETVSGDLTALIILCPACGQIHRLEVPTEGLEAWKAGTLIQNALPTLNDTQREQLMTGYCQPCWDEMWAEDEEEEEGDEEPFTLANRRTSYDENG